MTVALRIGDEAICRLARSLTEEYARLRALPLAFTEQAADATLLLLGEEEEKPARVPSLRLGRGGGDLRIPFPRDAFFAALDGALQEGEIPAAPGVLLPDGSVSSLTEGEWAIFAALASREGETVPRRALGAEEGSLNVLLCRLRSKLERDGQKRIFAKRGEGYRLESKGLRFETDRREKDEC
jgi:hypothetical protein